MNDPRLLPLESREPVEEYGYDDEFLMSEEESDELSISEDLPAVRKLRLYIAS